MNLSWIHLGGLFPTPLYHPALAGAPPEEGNWNYLGGCSRRRSTTYIPVGVHPCRREHARRKCDFHLASKSVTYVTDFGDTSLCRTEPLIQSEIP